MIGEPQRAEEGDLLPVGTPVLVKTQYLGSWSTGFVVADHEEDGYLLRRVSDGSPLPGRFGRRAVRPEMDAH